MCSWSSSAGGISTNVALKLGADKVTVAEGNPMIVDAVKDKNLIAEFTGQYPSKTRRSSLIPSDGRIYVKRSQETF